MLERKSGQRQHGEEGALLARADAHDTARGRALRRDARRERPLRDPDRARDLDLLERRDDARADALGRPEETLGPAQVAREEAAPFDADLGKETRERLEDLGVTRVRDLAAQVDDRDRAGHQTAAFRSALSLRVSPSFRTDTDHPVVRP